MRSKAWATSDHDARKQRRLGGCGFAMVLGRCSDREQRNVIRRLRLAEVVAFRGLGKLGFSSVGLRCEEEEEVA